MNQGPTQTCLPYLRINHSIFFIWDLLDVLIQKIPPPLFFQRGILPFNPSQLRQIARPIKGKRLGPKRGDHMLWHVPPLRSTLSPRGTSPRRVWGSRCSAFPNTERWKNTEAGDKQDN